MPRIGNSVWAFRTFVSLPHTFRKSALIWQHCINSSNLQPLIQIL